MGEKIGKVFLDDTLYPGQDLYSDGAIEDELLEIARDYHPEEFNRVIRERESWPILYHFFPYQGKHLKLASFYRGRKGAGDRFRLWRCYRCTLQEGERSDLY